MKNKNKKQEIFSYNFFKKNRKANLLPEEVLKIVIAVICIGFLAFLLVSLYFSATGNKNIKDAQDVVGRFANETKIINLGGGRDNPSFFISNPSGWYVFSFINQDIKPNSCAGENCLCVCEKLLVGIVNIDSRQAQRCDDKDKGACVVIANLKKFDAIKIKKGGIFVSISSKDINGQIQISG